MSKRERKRLEVMSQVKLGVMTLAKGSELLELSYRQAKRLRARYEAEGDGGLVHRLRGRPSNRRGVVAFREQVLARYVEKYGDYGPTLAAESLAAEDLGCRFRPCGVGCWKPACGRVTAVAKCIGKGGRGVSIRASCCSWTVPITTGSRVADRKPC